METRIRRNIIILIVVTFLVLIGMSAGWFFVLVRPQREEIAKTQTQYEDLKSKAATLNDALKTKQQAEDKLNYLKGQLAFFRGGETNRLAQGLYRRLYFGEIDSSDPNIKEAALDVAWRSWMNEYHDKRNGFGPALEYELRRARDASGVSLTVPAVKVDDPPQMPEDVLKKIPNNGFLKPLSATNNGSLALQTTGDFQSVLRFFESINRSDILMVVGNVKLEGYSPSITASFTVTPYLVAAGPGAKLTATSGAATGGGAGGAGAPGGPGVAGGATPPTAGGDAKPADEKADKAKDKESGVVAEVKNPRNQAGF